MIDDRWTGAVFERGDLAGVVAAIRYILDNGDLARRLGVAACQEIHDRFSVFKTFAAYRRLYRELLTTPARA